MIRTALAALLILLGAGSALAETKWEVVRTLPHDTNAFTQGFFIADGVLYESTGQVGRSDLRAIDLKTGKVIRRQPIDPKLFGEGIAPWGNHLVSITWRTGKGFVWQRRDFKPVKSFTYSGEGWGLTADAKRLILSDGTANLRFFDPVTLKEGGKVTVTWQGQPVKNLNELEYVNGQVFANIWYSPLIARIDPKTGTIADFINLAPLVARNIGTDSDSVLNGIAWDAKAKLLYVTGKNWPTIYALRLTD